ncbi:hypothetical protein [Gordonia sp. (in: high G+C Gram-positive bacteria)]|uniref:hypothetical protein n=1 Tax=Gordonia sp. (in: high G+C Gram-positive bacteria) TaxID=84139 RepID=UPI003529C88B
MKKKSINKATVNFQKQVAETDDFLSSIRAHDKAAMGTKGLRASDIHRCYEQAILDLYRSFEGYMLACLIACLNHDPSEFRTKGGREWQLPKHINQSVCELLICKGGYFDFSGRSGLLSEIKGMGLLHV